MPREIVTTWTTPAGSDFATVTFWDVATGVVEQRAALQEMWEGVAAALHSSVRWRIEEDGRDLDNATGGLTGAWQDSTPRLGQGLVSDNQPVPDASQVLVRWSTGSLVNGRFLQGRSFVPGLLNQNVIDGEVAEATRTGLNAVVSDFAASAPGFGVWSRPKPGRAGVFRDVVGATVWNELAVLRRRRG